MCSGNERRPVQSIAASSRSMALQSILESDDSEKGELSSMIIWRFDRILF